MESKYTNQENVEAVLGRALTAKEISLLEMVIQNVSENIINAYTSRKWNDIDGEAPTSEERIYDGEGGKEVYTHDFTDLEEVNLLNAYGDSYLKLTADTDWILYPLNKNPKQSIRLRLYALPKGDARVSVKAIFSSGDVPSSVVYVASQLVARFIEQQKSISGFKRENIEGYSYEILTGKDQEDEVESLLESLDNYKKVLL